MRASLKRLPVGRLGEEVGQGVGDDGARHEIHDVERHAEDRFVLAHVVDRRHRHALAAQHLLDLRLSDHVMG